MSSTSITRPSARLPRPHPSSLRKRQALPIQDQFRPARRDGGWLESALNSRLTIGRELNELLHEPSGSGPHWKSRSLILSKLFPLQFHENRIERLITKVGGRVNASRLECRAAGTCVSSNRSSVREKKLHVTIGQISDHRVRVPVFDAGFVWPIVNA